MKQGEFSLPQMKKLRDFLLKYKLILLVLAAGLILLLLPSEGGGDPDPAGQGAEVLSFDLEELESRMEKALSQIEGVGELSLVLTLESGVEEISAVDAEYIQDEDRITERITTVLKSGTGSVKEPAVIRRNYPVFRGALVVCEGGDDPDIKLSVTKAVSALTGLGADKITVCR